MGPLEVHRPGGRSDLPARKPRLVLLRLLVGAGKPVATDALADALWGDEPPANSAKLVQIYVSQLRKAIGAESIRTLPGAYLLAAAPEQVDAHRFADLLADGRRVAASGNAALAASLFRQALDLWRGPAYAEVADEPFAEAEAARLAELHAECVEEKLTAELAAGQGDVLSEVSALVTRHPLREALRALHIEALARAGRRADALAAYREARLVLLEELGLEPGPRLREAHRFALGAAQDTPAAALATRRLPEPPTPLVGRDRSWPRSSSSWPSRRSAC
ncbi:BTAD domain-containing putative transcriptional regulator [Actinokineospora soli]|uniref:BTAD domain-containing putative transcriptional regulator n=1 Tax=Actinokineospora soli TaxID=1048753 RepID=A0ABW2TME8_9PSEU